MSTSLRTSLRTSRPVFLLALGLVAGAGAGYWGTPRPAGPVALPPAAAAAHDQSVGSADRPVLYYRDPAGAPSWSAVPKQDPQGRAYLPVHDDEEPSFEPKKEVHAAPAAPGERKLLYYRNPMGLTDTSPVPKKDSMGMDYVAVYAGDAGDDAGTLKISLGRVQRAGVRTEAVEARVLVQPVRAVGTVAVDERRLTIVSLRAEGFIEELLVNSTGQAVQAGDPLFRVYSSQIQQAQIDLLVALGAGPHAAAGQDGDGNLKGGMQRLRNLDVPEARIREIRESRTNPRTIDWPAPASGTVIAKKVISGQRVMPGDELYRIADLSRMWVIADVAESDLALVKIGTRAVVTLRAYPTDPLEGEVTLVYPELKTETRTGRVRIELPNPEGRLKTDMYADVVFRPGADDVPVPAVPDSAVIDDGGQPIVLVARGEGRFEPRPVKLGRHGEGYREVLDGVGEGEEIVTTANFLIDAESNLRSALKTFSAPGAVE